MSKPRIYLDNNATTQIDPEVRSIFLEMIDTMPLNASSVHSEGQRAKTLLSKARRGIAASLGCQLSEVVFTSGATEGLNMTLRGAVSALYQNKKQKVRVLSTEIEHSCVYETLKALENEGFIELVYLPVQSSGRPELGDFVKALESSIDLAVLSGANSETGVKIDLEGFAHESLKSNCLFVLDATALCGKERVSIPDGVSAAVFSSHKFHGPMGSGFCMIRSDFPSLSQSTGGGQEFKRRSGTENIPAIVAMAKAFEIAQSATSAHRDMAELRNQLEKEILAKCPDARVNGSEPRLTNTTNIYFPGVQGDSLVLSLDLAGLSVSLGSACATGTLEPSRVLLKMGLGLEVARGSVRISLSRFTTKEEVQRAAQIIIEAYQKLVRV